MPVPSPRWSNDAIRRCAAERAGAIIALIGNRGDADDLAFLLIASRNWNRLERRARLQSLQILADAAVGRGIRPSGDLTSLEQIDPPASDKPTADERPGS